MRETIWMLGISVTLALGSQALASEGERTSDQGAAEDVLQAPANETGNQSDSDSMQSGSYSDQGISETAVPGESQTVSGKIAKIDKKSGYFTLKTDAGKDLKLHADPSLLKQQGMTKGAEVTAHYEMRGKMRHVTELQEGGATGSQPMQTQPGGTGSETPQQNQTAPSTGSGTR